MKLNFILVKLKIIARRLIIISFVAGKILLDNYTHTHTHYYYYYGHIAIDMEISRSNRCLDFVKKKKMVKYLLLLRSNNVTLFITGKNMKKQHDFMVTEKKYRQIKNKLKQLNQCQCSIKKNLSLILI